MRTARRVSSLLHRDVQCLCRYRAGEAEGQRRRGVIRDIRHDDVEPASRRIPEADLGLTIFTCFSNHCHTPTCTSTRVLSRQRRSETAHDFCNLRISGQSFHACSRRSSARRRSTCAKSSGSSAKPVPGLQGTGSGSVVGNRRRCFSQSACDLSPYLLPSEENSDGYQKTFKTVWHATLRRARTSG